MNRRIVFGLGGYDPDKPDDNLLEMVEIPDEVEE